MYSLDRAVGRLLAWEVIGRVPSVFERTRANFQSQGMFNLVQLRDDHPWNFVKDSMVTLSGAHGSEIVRSFCFLDQVCLKPRLQSIAEFSQYRMVLTAGEDGQIKSFHSP